MADFPCPKGDYTASKPSEAEAAADLADHLLKAHCRTDAGSVVDAELYEQLTSAMSQIAVRVRSDVSAGPVDLDARGR
jgi:hypothetical protein